MGHHVGPERSIGPKKPDTMRGVAGSATAWHGQPEGHRHAAEVSEEHSEDHTVHEDGVSRKVRQGREGPQAARPYGNGAQAFYTSAEVGSEAAEKTLYVAMTSDRGLCGGVHSSICKTIRNELLQKSEGELANVGIICVGDKARAQLSRLFPKQVLAVGSEIGRLPPQFGDASKIATNILNSGFEFDHGKLYFNEFKSVVSYNTKVLDIYSPAEVELGQEP